MKGPNERTLNQGGRTFEGGMTMAGAEPFRIGPFVLTDEEVRKRKAYLCIEEVDERLLQEAHPHVVQHVDRIVGRFYEYLLSHEHTRALLSAPGLLDRLKKIQTEYFLQLTGGRYDLEYFENRLRVGLAHERVGLDPEWYLGAYNRYLQIVNDVLSLSYGRDFETYFRTSTALSKVVYLDMSLALDAYIFSAQERMARKADELERANSELRKLDAAKRRLTDMIVHDLQNPLAGIVSFLQVLKEKREGLTAEERVGLDEALARCSDLSELILNVLQMSRAEEGRLELYLENVDLADLARRAAAAFQVVARQGSRVLEVTAEAEPVILRTDQSLLRRILYNLIRNALRHTPAGTRVEIHIGSGPPPRIAIRDDGPGLPPEVRERVFEPTSGPAYGSESGLGLAFCKMAAETLGLDLRIESDVGDGACFVLEAVATESMPSTGQARR